MADHLGVRVAAADTPASAATRFISPRDPGFEVLCVCQFRHPGLRVFIIPVATMRLRNARQRLGLAGPFGTSKTHSVAPWSGGFRSSGTRPTYALDCEPPGPTTVAM